MKNPFVYGEAVTGDHFCNRTEETKQLAAALSNSQKIFLIAARRIGKTSLVKTVLEKLRRTGIKGIYFDIEGITSYKKFLESYLTHISREFTVADRIVAFAKKVLPGIALTADIDETNTITLGLKYGHYNQDLEAIASKIYDLPAKIAGKKGFVVIFDEFQEIAKLNGGHITASIRSVIQHQRNVGYVFAGSKRHVLLEMVHSQESPFFKIGPLMLLEKIDAVELTHFLTEKFHKTKMKITDTAVSKIVSFSERIPYYTQMLAFEAWEYGKEAGTEVDEHDIDIIIELLIKKYEMYFREKWSSFIMTKKQVMQIIAREGGENLLSKSMMEQYNLRAASTVAKTLALLKKDGLIDKDGAHYYIEDILFKEWIKRNTY